MNEDEKKVVEKMIKIYCKAKHNGGQSLCNECGQLNAYVMQRLNKCQFQESKPTCNSCPVHCYRADMRERIREVMRYAGPRMLFLHPIDAILHFYKEHKRRKKHHKKICQS